MVNKNQIAKSPQKPGVYFFKNKKGKIIYIGKAKNLRMRLASYLRNPTLKMMKEAEKLSWRETESDIDALILEANLIKERQPKYNVIFRDDKNYFFVIITRDKFPKIHITHQPTKNQKYIGIFTDGASLKSTLKMLRRIFPYCTCKNQHKRACVRAEIGLCLGICCLKSSDEKSSQPGALGNEYRKNIKAVINILSGKKQVLLKKLLKEMESYAKKQEFEEASQVREKILNLKKIFEHKHIIQQEVGFENEKALSQLKHLVNLKETPWRIEAYDISNLQGKNAVGSMVVFTKGNPDKKEYKKFLIKLKSTPDDTRMLKEILTRRISHQEWSAPNLILVDGGKAQLNTAKKALNSKIKVKIVALAKRSDELYLEDGRVIKLETLSPSLANFVKYVRDEAHRFAINYHKLRRKKELRK